MNVSLVVSWEANSAGPIHESLVIEFPLLDDMTSLCGTHFFFFWVALKLTFEVVEMMRHIMMLGRMMMREGNFAC